MDQTNLKTKRAEWIYQQAFGGYLAQIESYDAVRGEALTILRYAALICGALFALAVSDKGGVLGPTLALFCSAIFGCVCLLTILALRTKDLPAKHGHATNFIGYPGTYEQLLEGEATNVHQRMLRLRILIESFADEVARAKLIFGLAAIFTLAAGAYALKG